MTWAGRGRLFYWVLRWLSGVCQWERRPHEQNGQHWGGRGCGLVEQQRLASWSIPKDIMAYFVHVQLIKQSHMTLILITWLPDTGLVFLPGSNKTVAMTLPWKWIYISLQTCPNSFYICYLCLIFAYLLLFYLWHSTSSFVESPTIATVCCPLYT